jgi:adenine-specific DNA-methyltransferase
VFLSEVQDGLVPDTWWSHDQAGTNQDSKKELVELFPEEEPFGTPKPERLIHQIVSIATNPNDLILDSFLGSGTTAAVAHKMGRRWIGIEMGEHAATHCLPRLEKVVAGEQGGISAAVGWAGGGGFRFMRLGEPVFGADGRIAPEVRFASLAAFVWQQEARSAYVAPAPGALPGTPLIGVHEGTAIYLLYNGILGDRRPEGGNVLTLAVLQALKALPTPGGAHAGPKVVYGEACRLGPARLAAEGMVFRQIPYELAAQ